MICELSMANHATAEAGGATGSAGSLLFPPSSGGGDTAEGAILANGEDAAKVFSQSSSTRGHSALDKCSRSSRTRFLGSALPVAIRDGPYPTPDRHGIPAATPQSGVVVDRSQGEQVMRIPFP